jgi:hypothetical protein
MTIWLKVLVWGRVHLEKMVIPEPVKFPCSQEPATYLCPELNEVHFHSTSLKSVLVLEELFHFQFGVNKTGA